MVKVHPVLLPFNARIVERMREAVHNASHQEVEITGPYSAEKVYFSTGNPHERWVGFCSTKIGCTVQREVFQQQVVTAGPSCEPQAARTTIESRPIYLDALPGDAAPDANNEDGGEADARLSEAGLDGGDLPPPDSGTDLDAGVDAAPADAGSHDSARPPADATPVELDAAPVEPDVAPVIAPQVDLTAKNFCARADDECIVYAAAAGLQASASLNIQSAAMPAEVIDGNRLFNENSAPAPITFVFDDNAVVPDSVISHPNSIFLMNPLDIAGDTAVWDILRDGTSIGALVATIDSYPCAAADCSYSFFLDIFTSITDPNAPREAREARCSWSAHDPDIAACEGAQ